MMQIRISKNLRGNRKTGRHDQGLEFMKVLKGKPYINVNLPTLFLGCYNSNDYRTITKHKGKGILWWGGSDILKMIKLHAKFPKNIKHYSQTPSNRMELLKLNVRSKIKPLIYADPNYYKLSKLGNCVYVYSGWARESLYGMSMIKFLAKEFPNKKFILTRYCHKKPPFQNCEIYTFVDKNTLRTLYARSFCSIRPTKHDGFSQTVAELGLMGRMTGWIYDYPCSEKCLTLQDYIKFIEQESKRLKPNKSARDFILKSITKITDGDFKW